MRIVIPKSSGHQLLYSSFINKPTSFNMTQVYFENTFVSFISTCYVIVQEDQGDFLRVFCKVFNNTLGIFDGSPNCFLNVFFHQVSPHKLGQTMNDPLHSNEDGKWKLRFKLILGLIDLFF
jgi:hypothetical protein